jgi:hypothetical protein
VPLQSILEGQHITRKKTHIEAKSQSEIFANNDPVNYADPDGRFGKQANAVHPPKADAQVLLAVQAW